jgi:hypothetical protein
MATRPQPLHVPLATALRGSDTLGALLQRVRESQARLEAVAPLLPEPLRPAVRSGPLDDTTWSLLVASPAAAAKLRQMLPQLQTRLRELGWHELKIRLRVRRPVDGSG